MDEKGSLHNYVPSKELPKEVLELPLDETRCRFCGVSYLVHHEVNKLKEVIKELEVKLREAETLVESRLTTKESDNLHKQIDCLNRRLSSFVLDQSLLLKLVVILKSEWKKMSQSVKKQILATETNISTTNQSIVQYCHRKEKVFHCRQISSQMLVQSMTQKFQDEKYAMEQEKARLAVTLKDMEVAITNSNEKYAEVLGELKEANTKLLRTTTELKALQLRECDIQAELSCKSELTAVQEKTIQELETRLKNTIFSFEQKLELLKSNHSKEIGDYHHQILRKEQEVSSLQIANERDKQERIQKLLTAENCISQLHSTINSAELRKQNELKKLQEALHFEHSEVVQKLHKTVEAKLNQELQLQRTKMAKKEKEYFDQIAQIQQEKQAHILTLKENLAQEKKAFDAEVARHLLCEKEIAVQLEQYKQKLKNCEEKLADCSEKLKSLEYHKQMVNSNEVQLADLRNKLESSYLEIAKYCRKTMY